MIKLDLVQKHHINKYWALILIATLFYLVLPTNLSIADGIPIDRLELNSEDKHLAYAQKHINDDNYYYAAVEISRQLKKDSTLLAESAVLFGGNYRLVRITDNLYADRVGGFSPSGKKLIYARDTSSIHIDDGLFDSYEEIVTGIVIYDFETGQEYSPEIKHENPHKPRFRDDNNFYYLVKTGSSQSEYSTNTVYLYDLELGEATRCFEMSGDEYQPVDTGLVYYEWRNGLMLHSKLDDTSPRELFDNYTLLNLKRPLSMIQNISVCEDVIMFEAGHFSGKQGKSVYCMPINGGLPVIEPLQKKTFRRYGVYYPAVADSSEYAFICGDDRSSDIFYRKDSKTYRLTFDVGNKYYLAISPDGQRIVYSYMFDQDGIESFEIFMLDFTSDAAFEDMKYRFKLYELDDE